MAVVLFQRKSQDKLSRNDCHALEVDGLPALIAQIIKPYDCFVGILSELGEYPFEIGKEWGIVQSPFGGVLLNV